MLARAERHEFPVSLLLTDIDHFKKVNDTYGHPDRRRGAAPRGRASCKPARARSTSCARYGGEEFAIVLEATDRAGARQLAERIRQRGRAAELPVGKGAFKATLSLGIAVLSRGRPREGRDHRPRRPVPLRRQARRPQPHRLLLGYRPRQAQGRQREVADTDSVRPLLPGFLAVAGQCPAAGAVRRRHTDAEPRGSCPVLVSERQRLFGPARPATRKPAGAAVGRQLVPRRIARVRWARFGLFRVVAVASEWPHFARRRLRGGGVCWRGRGSGLRLDPWGGAVAGRADCCRQPGSESPMGAALWAVAFAGAPSSGGATFTLPPLRFCALRERVELADCPVAIARCLCWSRGPASASESS